ncbi:MAG TPA: DUF1579 family protein [Kofleriaceae bacterium]|jgi:hypothetical protein
MSRELMQRLEGVWTGTETAVDGDDRVEATARMAFQPVFDGRFMLCDYVLTAADRKTSVAHGVFRHDEASNRFMVTWFRYPAATKTQQTEGVTEGDNLTFHEVIDGRTTRVVYILAMDKLTLRTEVATSVGQWTTISEGAFRRR